MDLSVRDEDAPESVVIIRKTTEGLWSWELVGDLRSDLGPDYQIIYKRNLSDTIQSLLNSSWTIGQYLLNDFCFIDKTTRIATGEITILITEEEKNSFLSLYNTLYLKQYPNTLLICPLNESAKSYYQDHSSCHEGDSGLDLFCLEKQIISAGTTERLKFGIACQANSSYYLLPRSSISKTPLRMANSIGLIDQGYRGEIMAAVDHIWRRSSEPIEDFHIVDPGVRLFQLAFPDLRPIRVVLTNYLSPTSRGTGGFGSTNV